MSPWQSNDVQANGLKLHYTRTGGVKPPVVLAHGFSDDGLCWTPVARALEADYDVIMVDARGHGRSDAPDQGYGSADYAADLAGVIQALELEQPAVLGHSMGAATALMLAGTYADLPRAIILEDPPPLWMPATNGQAPARPSPMHLWITDLKRKTRAELMAYARKQSPTWPDAELGPWADAKLRFSFNILLASEPAPLNWPAILQRIACPVLLITADPASGALVTPEGADALRPLVPHVRVAHIAGAGHSIRREQFDRYVEVMRVFLAETNI